MLLRDEIRKKKEKKLQGSHSMHILPLGLTPLIFTIRQFKTF